MSVSQAVYTLAARVRELKSVIETEEATKTAFIIPFISEVLGYDVTDPREVIPEYTADVGTKRGEKVDFAIKSGDDFRFLIECKKIGAPLDISHASQLVRYFNMTDTEFAILTNGEVYEFYAQLDAVNRMDERPFMTLNLADVDERLFPHLEMCSKSRFDSGTIAAKAEELKYVAEIKKVLAQEFREPSAGWVRYLAGQVTNRRMAPAVVETFTRLVGTAGAQFLKDEANRRLRSAQDFDEGSAAPTAVPDPAPAAEDTDVPEEVVDDSGIVTTEEEIRAFNIIQAICCAEVPFGDVYMRDAKSYCAILYQDNNRKPIARLQLDRKVPRMILFDEERNENPVELESVEHIYEHAEALRSRVAHLRDS